MKQVTIRVKEEYQVYISDNILEESAHLFDSLCRSRRVVIITDQIVSHAYLNQLITVLESCKLSTIIQVISGLESDKSLATVTDIINFFGQNNVTSSDLVIALGDGVVSSIVGFCCSIYLLGIHYVSIPTTLLSMIDSSIGGKNCINTCYAQNLLGTYHHPCAVFCDTSLIKSLSQYELKDGYSEVIKCALVDNIDLFDSLVCSIDSGDFTTLIAQCIRTKNHFISADEFGKGKRMILSFGETVGNALERFSGYKMSYGQSVTVGMAMITKASEIHLLTKKGTTTKIIAMLREARLDTRYDIPLQYLVDSVALDRKTHDGSIDVVLLKDICVPFIHKFGYGDKKAIENFFKVLY